MALSIEVTGGRDLERSLNRLPRSAWRELRAEMGGRKGIAADHKSAIAKTFRGRNATSTRRGEKYLYSRNQKQRKQQIRHYVRGKSLATLAYGLFMTERGAIHETGGVVKARGGGPLAIPIGASINATGSRRRAFSRFGAGTIGGDVEVIKTPSGRVFLITRDSAGEPIFHARLVDSVRMKRRLGYQKSVQTVSGQHKKRLERAITRVRKQWESGRI